MFGFMLLSAASLATQADDSCGVRVAKLLSSGQAEPLVALFQDQAKLLPALQEMVEKVGPLLAVQEVSAPRFTQHKRMSVSSGGSGSTIHYVGYWVNATSAKLGEVQLHVAKAEDSGCSLLALHVDSAL